MNNLNINKHCKIIKGCNIYAFGIIEHLESRQLPVYRFFSKEKYAMDFMEGKVRLSTLYSCRILENLKARDESEGRIEIVVSKKLIKDSNTDEDNEFISDLKMRGVEIGADCINLTLTNFRGGSINMTDAYVLCTSKEISDYLIENFGKHCVKIYYPHLLSYYLHLRMREKRNSLYFKSLVSDKHF